MATPLRLAFAGTPDFAARHLQALLDSSHETVAVLTQPDRRAGRGKQTQASAVKALAQTRGLPVLQPSTLRDDRALAELAALRLDALVVVAYGLILPQPVLDLPRYGCINVHGSLLPRWRGAAPIQRAIEAGDPDSGVTIMRMDAGLDTGPMLATERCPIPPLATSGDLYELLAQIGPRLLVSVLDDLPSFLAQAKAQEESTATYAHKLDKNEACLDWTRPAQLLARQIRAFNPAPGCFSFFAGERVKLWRAQPRPETAVGESPGVIVDAGPQGIDVQCGNGTLRLQEMQFPGARALPVADLLRGRSAQLVPGQRFSAEP